MDEIRQASKRLKAAHDALNSEYEEYFKRLNDEEAKIEKRYKNLDERQKEIASANGNPYGTANDVMEINAGGKIIAAKRGTLCQIKGTRLEALFSGRWEKKLQRDYDGRIFLDVNQSAFQLIVDYLNELAISTPDNPPPLPTTDGENQFILDQMLELLGLKETSLPILTAGRKSGTSLDIQEATSFSGVINDALNAKLQTIKQAEENISIAEDNFDDEVQFIKLFASGERKDIVTLNVSGTSMATKRSSLMLVEESVLAQQFDDSKWTEHGNNTREWTPDDVFFWAQRIDGISDETANVFVENQITGNELLAFNLDGLKMLGIERAGTLCLLLKEIKKLETASQNAASLIEHSPYCFGKILDYLRMRQLHSLGLVDEPPLPEVRQSEKMRFEKVVRYYFPGTCAEAILGGAMPITIKMVFAASVDPNSSGEKDRLKDGRILETVTLVAAVRCHAYQSNESNNLLLSVEDGTGSIRVEFSFTGDHPLLEEVTKEHTYIRITGQVEDFGGLRHIIASDVTPITSGDELTNHLLAVAKSYDKHLHATTPALKSVQATVIECVRNMGADRDEGVHSHDIISYGIRRGFSADQVKDVVNNLFIEGHFYTTIDEHHWQYAS